MNAVASAQVWHRRLDHLNKPSLELMNRQNDNGIVFDGSIADWLLRDREKSPAGKPQECQTRHHNAPFHLVYGHLMGLLKLTACGGYEFVSKITDQFTKWTAVYLLCSEDQALAFL